MSFHMMYIFVSKVRDKISVFLEKSPPVRAEEDRHRGDQLNHGDQVALAKKNQANCLVKVPQSSLKQEPKSPMPSIIRAC